MFITHIKSYIDITDIAVIWMRVVTNLDDDTEVGEMFDEIERRRWMQIVHGDVKWLDGLGWSIGLAKLYVGLVISIGSMSIVFVQAQVVDYIPFNGAGSDSCDKCGDGTQAMTAECLGAFEEVWLRKFGLRGVSGSCGNDVSASDRDCWFCRCLGVTLAHVVWCPCHRLTSELCKQIMTSSSVVIYNNRHNYDMTLSNTKKCTK